MARGSRAEPFGRTPAEQLFLTGVEVLRTYGVDLSMLPAPLRRLAKPDPRPFWAQPVGAQALQLGGAFLARATGNPRIGLRIGREAPFGARGLLDYLLRSSNSIRHAYEHTHRMQALAFDYLVFTLHEEGPRAVVRAAPRNGIKMHSVLVDYRLARIVGVWRDVLGTECTPEEVHFTYPRPSSTQVYREVFGDARLCFGADTMAIWFASELLDRPLPGRDPQLWAILMQQAEQLLAQLDRSEGGLADRLEQLLIAALPRGKPGSRQIAHQLGMSERTLRRRLESEGESFQGVLDRARAKLAQLYLEDPALGTEDVARQLGFESGASLRRAYERWTGGPLRALRQARAAR